MTLRSVLRVWEAAAGGGRMCVKGQGCAGLFIAIMVGNGGGDYYNGGDGFVWVSLA